MEDGRGSRLILIRRWKSDIACYNTLTSKGEREQGSKAVYYTLCDHNSYFCLLLFEDLTQMRHAYFSIAF